LWYSAVERELTEKRLLSPSFLRLVEVIGAGHSNWVVAVKKGERSPFLFSVGEKDLWISLPRIREDSRSLDEVTMKTRGVWKK
jgi:hypothetical protein